MDAMATTRQIELNRIIKRAADAVGGQTQLVRALGLKSQGTISAWRKSGRIPAEHVLKIEELTQGAVGRHEVRPDLYPMQAA